MKNCFLIPGLILAAQPVAVSGAIIGIQADVSASVQELIDGASASINSDQESWDGIADVLPLQGFSELTTTDLDGVFTARGEAVSDFLDPARLDQANPEELGAEAGAFSTGDVTSYIVEAIATERRTILFTRDSDVVPVQIDFRADGTQTVESTIFVSGAILVWSTQADRDLSDALGEVSFVITGSDVPAPLFEATVSVRGQASGNVSVDATGGIEVEQGGLELLAGDDPATDIVVNQLAGLATVYVVLIPPQEHQYEYEVQADQNLELTAVLNARAENLPAGVGVATVVGRPFGKLAELLGDAFPALDGSRIQTAVNGANRALGEPSGTSGSAATAQKLPALCGAVGFAGMALCLTGIAGIVRFARR